MKHLAIAAIGLWLLFQLGRMLWSSNDHGLEEAFAKFIEAPRRTVENPYHNGYFYLFGLTAAAQLDPAKTGYEIWVEESEDGRHSEPNQKRNRANRSDLAPAPSPDPVEPAWEADDPLNEFRKKDSLLRDAISRHQMLLTRYEHWLGMPFDDWGFGRRIVPLGKDILAVHRLYVAEGFFLGTMQGLERLRQDLQLWRIVLRDAKTIGTKVLAEVVISDDLQLLSQILAKPSVDKAIMTMGLQLTLPLSPSEYSLRWPIRNQIALAVKDGRAVGIRSHSQMDRQASGDQWLLQTANLPLHAFDGIEHPSAPSTLGVIFPSGQASKTYAVFYDAVIKASENDANNLPRLQEIIGTVPRGFFESILNPHPVEPGWEAFHHHLVETDTRLRLASLQIQLRRASAQTAVPTRLAEVGSQYFDPFTGLPMLWSPTQQKLYSVGKDRLDDGGDPTFDISVSAIIAPPQSKAIAHTSATARASRR